jgi:hypothetical protein
VILEANINSRNDIIENYKWIAIESSGPFQFVIFTITLTALNFPDVILETRAVAIFVFVNI